MDDGPGGLVAAVASGDRVASLRAIRDHLALRLVTVGGRDAAATARELREVITELDQLAPVEVDQVDDVAARRARRLAGAAAGE